MASVENRLAVDLCGIGLDNPVIPASGTFGYGREFAELYASCGGTVYHYDFNWMEDRFPGPCHGSDLLMVFGAERFLGNPKLLMGLTVQQLDEAGRPMRRIWGGFARDGTVDTTDIEGMLHIARIE